MEALSSLPNWINRSSVTNLFPFMRLTSSVWRSSFWDVCPSLPKVLNCLIPDFFLVVSLQHSCQVIMSTASDSVLGFLISTSYAIDWSGNPCNRWCIVNWLNVSDIPISGYAFVIMALTLEAYSWIDSLELFLMLFKLALTVSAGDLWENLSLKAMLNIVRSSLISGPKVAAKFNASSFRQNRSCSCCFSSDQL